MEEEEESPQFLYATPADQQKKPSSEAGGESLLLYFRNCPCQIRVTALYDDESERAMCVCLSSVGELSSFFKESHNLSSSRGSF